MKCEFIRGNVNEWNEWCEIRLDGKQIAYGHDFSETPEDANLWRDLNFILNIPYLLRRAYRAGENGEGWELIRKDDDLSQSEPDP